jgi:hypothetical protein
VHRKQAVAAFLSATRHPDLTMLLPLLLLLQQ